jgi:hypothetical protein
MTGSSLEVIAKAVGGTVQQATDLTMENTMLPNVGPEAKVVGAHLHFRLIKYLHQSKETAVFML